MEETPGASRDSGHSATGSGSKSLLLEHVVAILLALTDFVLFQTVATLLCVAIYFTIPALDASIGPGGADWRWIDIFRIVSPTFTVSGGAVTVLTSYFFARKSQEEARLRQEAEQQRQEETRRRQQAEQQSQEAEQRSQEAEQQRQQAEQQSQEAEQRSQEAEQQRQEEARLRQEAEAEVQTLKAQLEQATTPRRRHRRRLRNGASPGNQ